MTSVALRGFAQRAGSRAAGISPFKMVGLAFAWCAALLAGALGAAPEQAWAQPAPVVTSISPAEGPQSGGTQVYIRGEYLALHPTPTVYFGAAQSEFTMVIDATTVLAIAPPGSGTQPIRVITVAGASAVNPAAQFTYISKPIIGYFDPSSGPMVGGSVVQISGDNFEGVTEVKFGAATALFTVEDASTITAIAPPGTGSVKITVTSPEGAAVSTDTFTYKDQPTVYAALPASGPIAGGNEVVIAGAALDGVTGVYFGNVTSPRFVIESSNRIVAIAPKAVAGESWIAVRKGAEYSPNSAPYRYLATPTVTSLSPDAGPAVGGAVVTIAGTNLIDVTEVLFGDTPVEFQSVGSSLRVTAPVGEGTVQVIVKTPGGVSSASTASLFTYGAAPTINSASGVYGPLNGGTSVAINGAGFTGVNSVKFGDLQAASFAVESDTKITAVTPAGAAGRVDIVVGTPGGSSAATARARFNYVAPPVIDRLTPPSGLSGGLRISGEHLNAPVSSTGGAPRVTFGGTVITATATMEGDLDLVIPAGAPGSTADVTVTTIGGSATAQFVYSSVPTISWMHAEAEPGGGIRIIGTNLAGVTRVFFGALEGRVDGPREGELIAWVPEGVAGQTVDVRVESPAGTSAIGAHTKFTFLARTAPPLSVASMSPISGPAAGGTVVTITGAGFTPSTTVLFLSYPGNERKQADVVVVSATELRVTAPQGYHRASVYVTTPAGTAQLANPFEYVGGSYIDRMTPWTGPVAGGAMVSIDGEGFTPTSIIKFGDVPATDVVFHRSNLLYVTTPPGTGAVDVSVTTDGQVHTFDQKYTYVGGRPTISLLLDAAGEIGERFRVLGYGFTGATAVNFGSLVSTSLRVASDTELWVTVPNGTIGQTVDLTVVGPDGVSAPASFTFGKVPVIDRIEGLVGGSPAAGGATITVIGRNFTGATAVRFGDVEASFTVVDGEAITVTVPPGPAGTSVLLTVVRPHNASNAFSFYYMPDLVVTPDSPLVDGVVGRDYRVQLALQGAPWSTDYVVELASGALPPGVTLDKPLFGGDIGALVEGVPTTAGDYSFEVRFRLPNGRTVTESYVITISAPTVTVLPTSLPPATLDVDLEYSLNASGGVAPYSFSVDTLPPGLSLTPSTGVISGRPTEVGSYRITVTATDSSTPTAMVGSRAYDLVVGADPPVVAPTSVQIEYNTPTPIDLTSSITGHTASVSVATQPSNGSVNINGLVVTYTPTAGYVGPDSFVYTATGPGGVSEPATVTVTVQAPVFVFQPQTLADAKQAVAYSATIGATGGTAPYSYSIVSGALPTGLEMSAGGIIQGMPTASGVFNFTVKVVDASTGLGASGTQTFTFTVGAPPLPVAGPKAATAAYQLAPNGGAAEIDLSDVVQHASGLQITQQPPNGSVAINGLVVTYTPTAGYVGPDSFVYTATGPGGVSEPATVTITVQAPVFVFQPQTLADATQAVAYSATIGATGGTAPYSYSVVAGALPAGLEMSAGGIIQGMPTTSGVFNFTVKVVDASTGLGASASHDFTLTVGAPPPPVAEPKEVTVSIQPGPNGGSAEIDLSDAVQYASGIQITRQPSHGTLTVEGFKVTYTPEPGFYGEDSFDYEAVPLANNPMPLRIARAAAAGATVTITIAPPTLAFDQSTLANGQEDMAYRQSLTASGGTAPYSYAVTIGSLPAGLTLSSDGVLSGTPRASANFQFTVTATDSSTGAGPFLVSQGFSLTIDEAVPQTAAPIEVATIQGKEVIVDLTAGAIGGPFTGAAVVTVTPADSGVAKIVETGSGSARGYSLSFTSTGTFSGEATVTYTLSNASGVSAPGTVTITVEARPDPSQDPDVRGMVTAQTDAALRMAEAQITNFGRRMESLHSGGSGRFQQGITLGFGFADGGLVDPWTQREIDMKRSFDFREETMASAMAQNPTMGLVHRHGLAASGETGAAGASGSGVAEHGQVSIWTGGSIQFGRRDPKDDGPKFDFTTGGLSMGADLRVNERLAIGVGGGFGQSTADVGSAGSRVEASNYFGVLYGSLQPVDGAFIDGMIGYGKLDFDTRRKVAAGVLTPVDLYATGSRSGDQLILSVSAGWDFRRGDLFISPYARISSITGTLDAYSESGAGLGNLRYDDQDLSSLKIALGARGERTFATDYGSLTPRFRFEYQRELKDSELTTLSYDDWVGGPLFSVISDPFERDQWLIGIGGELRRKRLKVSLDYQGSLASGRDFVSELTGQISFEF